MTFQEKSIWTTLIVTIIIFGYYYYKAAVVFTDPAIPDESLIGLFSAAVFIVILSQIVLQGILAVINRREAEKGEDERDKIIELKAIRISYFILVFGVITTCISIFLIKSPMLIVNLIFFFFLIAEAAGMLIQLLLYRRGI